jgi:DNA repair exonuclease SbcCD ATPase subunit
MFKELRLKNVGPASSMTLEFGDRLNLITGDNGLGKSFLLDIMWWSLTRKWPAEINLRLNVGKKFCPIAVVKRKFHSNSAVKKSQRYTPASTSVGNNPGPVALDVRLILDWCYTP